MTFDDFGLNANLLKAVHEAGYSVPTPIQAQAIPKALADRDILGIAQTGTGKTASFTLPMIERLSQGRPKARMPRSLILEPTRELAAQIAENFEKYGKYHKLSMALLIGGVSFGDQDKKLDRGVDVLIATPGRLLDHVERGKLMLTGVQTLVIDEADRMLDMGFIPDIERICKLIPFTRQTMLFSATMPPEIENLANTFMQAPARIEVARAATTAESITQRVVMCGAREKRARLIDLIAREDIKNAIIFCNRKRDVDVVARALKKSGLNASPIHGDLDQSVRTQTLDYFRDGTLRILVASDVAARGLDIPEVSHVINYDVPTHPEDYVHRIGRTGRAGRDGAAFTLATSEDRKYLDAVEKLIGKTIDKADTAAPAQSGGTDAPATETTVTDADNETQGTEPDAPMARDQQTPPRGRRQSGRSRANRPPQGETHNSETTDTAAPDARPADTAPPKPRSRRRGGDNRGQRDKIVGMGDHVPAFILRPSRLPTPAASQTTAKGSGDKNIVEAESDAA